MRIALTISYNGEAYYGFQKQIDKPTIQQELENTLKNILNQNIKIVGSGRTDAKVSALRQIVHCDIDDNINLINLKKHMNAIINKDISILLIKKVNDNFNSRINNKQTTYKYFFYLSYERIPIYDKFALQVSFDMNITKLITDAKEFVGTYDFTSFKASNTSIKNNIRTIYDSNIIKINDDLFVFTVTGNGFLYNMVRIMMGTLIDCAKKDGNQLSIKEILEKKDRIFAGHTVSPIGLILYNIEYLKRSFYGL